MLSNEKKLNFFIERLPFLSNLHPGQTVVGLTPSAVVFSFFLNTLKQPSKTNVYVAKDPETALTAKLMVEELLKAFGIEYSCPLHFYSKTSDTPYLETFPDETLTRSNLSFLHDLAINKPSILFIDAS